jgi:hypothetical protein
MRTRNGFLLDAGKTASAFRLSAIGEICFAFRGLRDSEEFPEVEGECEMSGQDKIAPAKPPKSTLPEELERFEKMMAAKADHEQIEIQFDKKGE